MKIGAKVASAIVAMALSAVGCSSSSSSTGSSDIKCTYTMAGAFTYSGGCETILSGGNGSITDAGTQLTLITTSGTGTDNFQFTAGLQAGPPSTAAAGSYTQNNVAAYDIYNTGAAPKGDSELIPQGQGALTLKVDSVDNLSNISFVPHGSLDTTLDVFTGPLYPDGGGPTASLHLTATF